MRFLNRDLGWLFLLWVSGLILATNCWGDGRQNQAVLIVEWQPNNESDLAGYRVYYGTGSHNYPQFVDVGNATRYRIQHLEEGVHYFIAITAYDSSGNESNFSQEVSGEAWLSLMPEVCLLYQNYPNPFPGQAGNPETEISFYISSQALISLEIYNLLGKRICVLYQGERDVGLHTVEWDGRDQGGYRVSSGVYSCVLKAGKILLSKRLIVIH